MAAGLALAVIGLGALTQIDESSGIGVAVSGFVALSLGLAPVFTLATDVIIGAAPPDRAGAASAISEPGSELGGPSASRSWAAWAEWSRRSRQA